MIYLVTGLALFEFFNMALPVERSVEKFLGIGGGLFYVALVSFAEPGAWFGGLTLLFLFFSIFFLFRVQNLGTVIQHLALVFLGLFYISFLLGHIPLIRELDSGRNWIFLVLLLVMASDTAAYFTGITLGQHKLYPLISPKKSIEGSVGGLIGSIAGAFLAKIWFFSQILIWDALFLGLTVGILAQIGDLFESMLKRNFGVKDSGSIIPGHGGILDRLDSLLFAFPLVYYYALLRFG